MLLRFKPIILCMTLLFCSAPSWAQLPNLIWSDTVLVWEDPGVNAVRPRIAVTANGEPIIVFGVQSAPNEMWISDWNGIGFERPVNIIPSGIVPRINYSSGPDIATYGNTVYVTYSNAPDEMGNIYLQKSIDGGYTFGDTVRVNSYPDSITVYSPSVDATDDGNPAIVFYKKHASDTSTFAVVATRSNDGGLTYNIEENCTVNSPGVPTDCCQPTITVNGNRHAVLYRNDYIGSKEIYTAISDNNGASFDTVVHIDQSNFNMPVCPSSSPSGVLMNDTLYGVWMTMGSGIPRVQLGTASSVTGGFGINMDIDPTVAPSVNQNYGEITGSNDTLGVVWSDDRNSGSTNDCFFRYSVSGTNQFSATYNIHGGPMTGNQILPDIAFHNGVFHMVYADYDLNQLVYVTATIDPNTSVTENTEPQFTLSPNPFNETLAINLWQQQNAVATLYDITGKQMLQHDIAPSHTINTSDLAPGIYMLKVVGTKGNLGYRKVVKQ